MLVPVNADIASEVCDCWNRIPRGGGGTLDFLGRELYVVPERSEREKPRYAAMGRIRGLVEARKQVEGTLDFNYKAGFMIYHAGLDGHTVLLVFANREHRPNFSDVAVHIIGCSKAQLLEEYDADNL